MGFEAWIDAVLFETDAARRFMQKLIPFFVRLANQLLAAGAAFIASPCGLASPAIVPREIVTGFSLPALSEALSQLHGPVVLHHAGAPVLAHLDLLAGLPSVIAFVLDERDDIERGRQIVGTEPVLFSGPMGTTLPGRTVSQVEDACRAILENRRCDPRFILCTCGPDVPWDTPPENIRALRRMAESHAGARAMSDDRPAVGSYWFAARCSGPRRSLSVEYIGPPLRCGRKTPCCTCDLTCSRNVSTGSSRRNSARDIGSCWSMVIAVTGSRSWRRCRALLAPRDTTAARHSWVATSTAACRTRAPSSSCLSGLAGGERSSLLSWGSTVRMRPT